jgi:DNA-binding MarR family transcriptional regulator
VTNQAGREAWRLLQSLLFDGEGHGRLAEVCQAMDIPPSLVKALIHLSPDQGRPMREMAEHFSCDASYITSLVDGLEKKGLAERRPSPIDRRVKTVVLTAHGKAAQADLFEMMWEPPKSFNALTGAEQRQLRDLLRKVADADETLQASLRGETLHSAPAAG